MKVLCTVTCSLLFAAALPAAERTPVQIAKEIDAHIAQQWKQAETTPAPRADDAEFLRRVYLDLAGQIPRVSEVRSFLEDTRPNKRQLLVDELLSSPRYVTHFTTVWKDLLLPEAQASLRNSFLLPSMTGWIRKNLVENASLTHIVNELVTYRTPRENRGYRRTITSGGASPGSFYQAKENKPENLAANVSKLFLGVKMECAQCHDHPFGDWSQEQFWSLAAFFKGEERAIEIPGKNRKVEARFLDGTKPDWSTDKSAKEVLAEWMCSPRNPYLARAGANRMWAYFFGTGLIDPVDEMVGCGNTPSHPEVLDLLAREFRDHGYDMKFLIRTIVSTRAYQLSSRQTHETQEDVHLSAKMPVRGLAPEQLLDSLMTATGYEEANSSPYAFVAPGRQRSERARLLGTFAKQAEKTPDYQVSILQALALMNGRLTAEATDLKKSNTLAALLDSPFLDTNTRVEALVLATLSRKPTSSELQRYSKYIEEATDLDAPDANEQYGNALADVFWVLLNSSEFLFNH